MAVRTEPQHLPEGLHDAVVMDVRLDGLDLVLQVSMPVYRHNGRRRAGTSNARGWDTATRPTELVFKQFHGQIPWSLKGQTLELIEEKDGAYLLETDTLEDHIVWASSLYLRLSPLGEESLLTSSHGARR